MPLADMDLALLASRIAVAAAAGGTGVWDVVKQGYPSMLGRGEPERTRFVERELESMRGQLEGVSGTEKARVRGQLEAAWQARIFDLLQQHPDASAQVRAVVDQVRAQSVRRAVPGAALGAVIGTAAFPGAAAAADAGSQAGVASAWIYGVRHYLECQCPENVPAGEPFSLLVAVLAEGSGSRGQLKPFDVPLEGRDVLVTAHAPGLLLLGPHRAIVHVPFDGDSEPVMFELRADSAGPHRVSVTAWLGGSYLGELLLEVTAERSGQPSSLREVRSVISMAADGAVSLVVRYDPAQNAYRFEFRDEDNPGEVTSHLAYDPQPLVERLVAGLDELARGHSGYSPAQARDYMVNAGAAL
jgi:hypothetical protein